MSRGFAVVGLWYPKHDVNVGGVMRAANCYQADMVQVYGQRYRKMPTDTLSTHRHIPLIETPDLRQTCPYDCVPVAVECVEGAFDLRTYRHPERAMYIFGPEDGSLPKNIVDFCRDVVQIPTRYCMNLAATVNVVLYDRLAKGKKTAVLP